MRKTVGKPLYTRKNNQQSFRIRAIYAIKHSESDAGGRISTTIPRKKLDLCINDIGGLPPKPEDSVIVMAPEDSKAPSSQENFTVTDV